MIRCDFHMHTTFCDGKNTAEEMVLAAIQKGMTCIGISTHAMLQTQYSVEEMTRRLEAYRTEMARLKEKYAGQIELYCGVELELDMNMPIDLEQYDYVIGSLHDLYRDGKPIYVDYSPEYWERVVDEYYGGDSLSFVEDYYENLARLADRKIDIIGHFDLCTKFNRDGRLFDENDPRYLCAAYRAADALLPLGIPFEINMGAIARGYQDHPYPNTKILEYIVKNGGRVMLSSDAHSAENIAFGFDTWEPVIRKITPIIEDWRP